MRHRGRVQQRTRHLDLATAGKGGKAVLGDDPRDGGRHAIVALGESQLTDAMLARLASQRFHALEYEGTTCDCRDRTGLLRANVAFAFNDPHAGAEARAAISALLAS